MQTKNPYSSRKFIFACTQMVVVVLLPVCYKLLGISDDILMICLTTSTAISSVYIGFNVMQSKKADG